jgi:hypothetical protein
MLATDCMGNSKLYTLMIGGRDAAPNAPVVPDAFAVTSLEGGKQRGMLYSVKMSAWGSAGLCHVPVRVPVQVHT